MIRAARACLVGAATAIAAAGCHSGPSCDDRAAEARTAIQEAMRVAELDQPGLTSDLDTARTRLDAAQIQQQSWTRQVDLAKQGMGCKESPACCETMARWL